MPRWGLVVALCASLFTAIDATPAEPPRPLHTTSTDVRGLWVLRTSLTSRESITTMVKLAQSGGFNTLLVQVRGRGEAFYRSDLEPRASDLDRQPPAFDPLATVIETARAAGLKVHAWINVNLVASGTTLPRSREHIALRHPEWIMAPRALSAQLKKTSVRSPAYLGTLSRWTRAESSQVEGLYLSPIPAASRQYTASVVRELVERYALDGVHLDYIRFPSADFDYSPGALSEFRQAQIRRIPAGAAAQLDRAAAADPAAWTAAHPDDWASFRRDRLTQLVTTLREVIRRARPTATISAAVVPAAAEARADRLQDWLAWTRAGLLDAVCPMIYTTDAAEFTAAVTELDAVLGDTPFWAGIGAYRLPVAATIDHVRRARRHGAGGVLLFSYDKLTDTGTSPTSFAALRPVLLDPPASSGGTK